MGVLSLTFAMFFLMPSDPVRVHCGKLCTPERRERIRHAFGLDHTVLDQYVSFMRGLVADRELPGIAGGKLCEAPCLGYSVNYNEFVSETVARTLPATWCIRCWTRGSGRGRADPPRPAGASDHEAGAGRIYTRLRRPASPRGGKGAARRRSAREVVP